MDNGQSIATNFLKMLYRGWFLFVIITEEHDYLCGLVGPLIAVHKGGL